MSSNQPTNLGHFQLNCGVTVSLDSIVQWRTYAGLIAGVPDQAMNERRISDAKKTAAEKLSMDCFIHLIIPEITMNLRSSSHGPAGKYPVLPLITCAAVLYSEPLDKSDAFGSALKIVWFQDAWALPVQPAVFQQICALPWSELAQDYWV